MNNTERSATELDINLLRHAPWNPRPEITEDDVKDITASILTSGLIQRIVVMVDPEDARRYIVIAGNRRLVACRAAGLETVPVDIIDCPVEEAKRKTLIENLQRKDVDPIMEADLIAGLVSSGMTEEEIAAETGRGNKWVWRRKQLQNLSDGWKDVLKKNKTSITVDCLEKISRYGADLQEAVLGDFKAGSYDQDWKKPGMLSWNQISRNFSGRTRELKSAEFSRKECEKCPHNSANAPTLFDFETERSGKPPKFGCCLNADCFEKKHLDVISRLEKRAQKDGCAIKHVTYFHSVPEHWNATKTPNDKNTVLYVYKGHNGRTEAVWSRPDEKQKTSEEETKARKDELEKKKALKHAKHVLGEIFDMAETDPDKIKDHIGIKIITKKLKTQPIGIFGNLESCAMLAGALCLSEFDDVHSVSDIFIKILEGRENYKIDIDPDKATEEFVLKFCEDLFMACHDDMDVRLVYRIFKDQLDKILPPDTIETLESI